MGYTQYWGQSRAFTSSEWETVKTLAEELTSYCEVPLDDLEISDNHIVFNGVEEDGHESFVLSIVPELQPWQDEHFDFCKTARKPYDVPVALLLLAIHHFVPNVLMVSGMKTPAKKIGVEAGFIFESSLKISLMKLQRSPKGFD